MKRWNNQLKTVALLGVLSVVLIGFGAMLGTGYLYAFTALALVLNLGGYYFSDRIVLRMHGASEIVPEAMPRLHTLVEDLAVRAGIPKPRVFLIDEPQPNAFATGRNPSHGVVAVTAGILDLLDERELRGVLAHEIAHIKNRDILLSTIAAALAAAVTYLANMLSFGAFFGGDQADEEAESGAGSLILAFVAPIAAMLVQLGISRSREYLADETGAAISGDPLALASALAKLERAAEILPADRQPATASLFIVNPLTGGSSLQRLFSTHPPMADRIERLTLMVRGGLRHAA